MSYLHARRVLHRDLKLENVMVTDQQDWHVTIVDFGLSRVFPQSLDGSRTGIKAAGTTSTAAPEVIRGEEYLMVSDVWSIGAMVYRLVGDRDPFLRDDRRDDPKRQKIRSGRLRLGAHRDHVAAGKSLRLQMRPHPGLRWAADAALRYWRARRPLPPLRHRRFVPQARRLAAAALRPVSIDTNVPETTEKRDKSRGSPGARVSLKRYGSYTELKRAANNSGGADRQTVREKVEREFLKIDTDASGTINEAELCGAGRAELDAPTKRSSRSWIDRVAGPLPGT